MTPLTDAQIDTLIFNMGKPHTESAKRQRDRYIEALIDEVREYRRRAMTSERYDNELVIDEDERISAALRTRRRIDYDEWVKVRPKDKHLCGHRSHDDCGFDWVFTA